METENCKHCGKEVQSDFSFCPYCGNDLGLDRYEDAISTDTEKFVRRCKPYEDPNGNESKEKESEPCLFACPLTGQIMSIQKSQCTVECEKEEAELKQECKKEKILHSALITGIGIVSVLGILKLLDQSD